MWPCSTVVCRIGIATVSPRGTVVLSSSRDSSRRCRSGRPATLVSGSRSRVRPAPFQDCPGRERAGRERREQVVRGDGDVRQLGDFVRHERAGDLDVLAGGLQQAAVAAADQPVGVGPDLGVAGAPAQLERVVPGLQRDGAEAVAGAKAPDAAARGAGVQGASRRLGFDVAVRRFQPAGAVELGGGVSRCPLGLRSTAPRARSGSPPLSRLLTPRHEGIPVVLRRGERLLDGPGRYPAQQVQHRAGLVVGAAGPGAPERLLPHHGAGGLVVHVVVAGGVAQRCGRPPRSRRGRGRRRRR